jgi:acetyl esterase/lipase
VHLMIAPRDPYLEAFAKAGSVIICRDRPCARETLQKRCKAQEMVAMSGRGRVGVSDIAALARDTHKFESHYLDWLIGPYPQAEALYRERSPLFHAERLSRPVIFFQGDEDPVVPPNQTEAMVEALRRRGITVGHFLFSGEQHGFRKAANIQRALDAELYFYAVEVFRTGLRF